jgi:hypothetical protein
MMMMMIGIIEIAQKRDYVVVGNNNNRNSVH